jgi:hypothetical protein
MPGIGVFHINKLAYLYEYFHIKNFGCRFTFDQFKKLPHGPVIIDYTDTFYNACKQTILSADKELIINVKRWNESEVQKKPLKPGINTPGSGIKTEIQYQLAETVIDKFASLSCKDLEKIVYSTQPMIAYMKRKDKGLLVSPYILTPDCIKMSDYRTSYQEGMKLYLKHIEKYPDINWKQQNRIAEELEWLEKYRPGID